MENRESLHSSLECDTESCDDEQSIERAMQQWLNNAQRSHDARDRVALANGISRGVFGRLHLGTADRNEASCEELEELDNFKRAA